MTITVNVTPRGAAPTVIGVGDRSRAEALADAFPSVSSAVAWANENGGTVRFGAKDYTVTSPLVLKNAALVGAGQGVRGGAKRTRLIFRDIGSSAAITTDGDDTLSLATISDLDIEAADWSTCTGYGLDLEAPIVLRNVTVTKFKKANIFLHQSEAGGRAPYNSLFQNVRSSYSGEHGVVVGTGANAITFINLEAKWNGSPSHGVPPTAAGAYDGFHVDIAGAGNPGGAYAAYLPEAIQIFGGDCSYNSRYGWHFRAMQQGTVFPAYAEDNLSADGFEVQNGAGLKGSFVAYGQVKGGVSAVGLASVQSSDAPSNLIFACGRYLGGGGTGANAYGFILANARQVLYTNGDGSKRVYTVPDSANDLLSLVPFGGAKLRFGSSSSYIEAGGTRITLPTPYDVGAITISQSAAKPSFTPTDTSRPSYHWNTAPAPGGYAGWAWCPSALAWKGFGLIEA